MGDFHKKSPHSFICTWLWINDHPHDWTVQKVRCDGWCHSFLTTTTYCSQSPSTVGTKSILEDLCCHLVVEDFYTQPVKAAVRWCWRFKQTCKYSSSWKRCIQGTQMKLYLFWAPGLFLAVSLGSFSVKVIRSATLLAVGLSPGALRHWDSHKNLTNFVCWTAKHFLAVRASHTTEQEVKSPIIFKIKSSSK